MVIGAVKLEMHIFMNITQSHYRWVKWLNGYDQFHLKHALLKLVAIFLAKVEIKIFLKSRDHTINESRDSMD